ncbi:hypothetical protein CPB86DRAFT_870836 [Serendipita vermifera]|nr:hypothetical protein CPB86DRAFT_870836 [Serendipita vermifera]
MSYFNAWWTSRSYSVISLDEEDYFQSQGATVSLPRVKSWKIDGGPDTLIMFDFSNAEKLKFCTDGCSQYPFDLALLPITVPEMVLNFTFTPEILSMTKPYSLLQVTTITFSCMGLPDQLHRYLHLPNLKKLSFDSVYYFPLEDTTDQTKYKYTANPYAFLDSLFFQNIPGLESLSLRTTEVDDKLLANLQYCPRFRELRFIWSPIKEGRAHHVAYDELG